MAIKWPCPNWFESMTNNQPASWNSSQIKLNHESLQPVNVLLVSRQSDNKCPTPCVCGSAYTAFSLSSSCAHAHPSCIFYVFITRVCITNSSKSFAQWHVFHWKYSRSFLPALTKCSFYSCFSISCLKGITNQCTADKNRGLLLCVTDVLLTQWSQSNCLREQRSQLPDFHWSWCGSTISSIKRTGVW